MRDIRDMEMTLEAVFAEMDDEELLKELMS